MKATAHNKLLGFLHLAYGGFIALVLAVFSILLLGMTAVNNTRGEEVPIGFTAVLIFAALINFVLVVPSFIAGYALLKQRSWAKTMGLIAGVLASVSFPFGSALCVYTIWFLFGENGRILYHEYHERAPELPPARQRWGRASRRLPEPEYVPPKTPPDWR